MAAVARSTVRALAWAVLACAAWVVLALTSAAGAHADEARTDAHDRPVTRLVDGLTEPLTGSVTRGLRPATDPVLKPVEKAVAPVVRPVTETVRKVAEPVVRPVVEKVAEPVAPLDREVVAPVSSSLGRTLAPVTGALEPALEPVTRTTDEVVPLPQPPAPGDVVRPSPAAVDAVAPAGVTEAGTATADRGQVADRDAETAAARLGTTSTSGPSETTGTTAVGEHATAQTVEPGLVLATPTPSGGPAPGAPTTSALAGGPLAATFADLVVLTPPEPLALAALPRDADHDSQHHLRPDVSPG